MALTDPLVLAQEVLREGPVVVLGSGVSMGISASLSLPCEFPSMSKLGHALLGPDSTPPDKPELCEAWKQARTAFKAGGGFERALDQVVSREEDFRAWAAHRIAEVVRKPDDAVREYFNGFAGKPLEQRHRAFGLAQLLFRLVNGLGERWPVLTVVTTNYDHLVEMACDLEGFPCHTGFLGHHLRWFEPDPRRWGTSRSEHDIRGRVSLRCLPHVRLYKPHGSLGWFDINGEAREIGGGFSLAKNLMVPPGRGKANQVMSDTMLDRHRSWAMKAFEKAKTAAIFGYGFNDEHLEASLRQRLRDGMPALLLTRTMTERARGLLDQAPQLVVGEATPGAPDRTTWTWQERGALQKKELPGRAWDLATFVQTIW